MHVSVLSPVLLLVLLGEAVADVAIGNHAPLLKHPKGLTADRKSQGALSLNLPVGFAAGHNAHPSNNNSKPFLIGERDLRNHHPLLNHPKGLTADRKSQGALSLALPHGFEVSKNVTNLHKAYTTNNLRTIPPPSPKKRSWFARLFGKEEGAKAPERVSVWDIDIEQTAIKRENRLPPPQHRGALYSHSDIPPKLRRAQPNENAVAKLMKLLSWQ